MNISSYIIVTTVAYLLLAIVWSKSGALNFVIKAALFLLAGYGAYLTITHRLFG